MLGNLFTSAGQLLAGQLGTGQEQVTGALATLVFCCGIWLVGWNRRQRADNKPGMASLWIIASCFLVALIAVGGATYGLGLRSSTGDVKTEFDIFSGKQFVPAKSPTPAGGSDLVTTSLISADKFYSPAEKERIVDTMNFIRDRFTNVGYPLMADADAALNAVSPVITPGKLDSLAEKMPSALAAADALGKDIDKIRNESQSYAMDFALLLRAKPVYLETFQEALGDFANILSVYRGLLPTAGSYNDQLRNTLTASGRNLSRAKHGFEQWMQECEKEMRKARTQLSQ